MGMPRAMSTSAEPDAEEDARAPCLSSPVALSHTCRDVHCAHPYLANFDSSTSSYQRGCCRYVESIFAVSASAY